MRCESCQKFVSMETVIEDDTPKIEVGAVSSEGDSVDSVTGTIHVSRNCADCGTELKALDFEVDLGDVQILGAPLTESERDEISAECEIEPTEGGGSRYAKNMIGYQGRIILKLGKRELATIEIKDSAPASHYEEC